MFLGSFLFFYFTPLQMASSLNLMKSGIFNLKLSMYFSALNFIFLLSLILIFSKILKFSFFYMNKSKYFSIAIWTFCLSMIILILSNSYFTLFVAWEGLGVSSFLLVMYYYNWNSLEGASLTMLVNRLGDGFMLMMLFMNSSNPLLMMIVFMMMMTKSAIYPFSSWLPAAMAAPTPVSALVHSSTLVTAGLYLNFKFKYCFYMISFMKVFLIMGITTMIFGSMLVLMSSDLKKMVAFSTLSQLGFLSFSFYSFNFSASLNHLISHAFLKSSLFIMVGVVIMNSSSQSMTFSSLNLMSYKYLLFICFIIMNFMSLLSTAMFISKEMILFDIKLFNFLSMLLVFISLTLTLLYSMRLLYLFNFYKFMKIHLLNITNVVIFMILYFLIINFMFKLFYKMFLSIFIFNSMFMTLMIGMITFTAFFYKFYTVFTLSHLCFMNNFFSSMLTNFTEDLLMSLKYSLLVVNTFTNMVKKNFSLTLMLILISLMLA